MTVRRPRRATAEQRERLSKYQADGRFAAPAGPRYVPARLGVLVRRDVYERERCAEARLAWLALYRNVPALAPQPSDAFAPAELVAAERLSAAALGRLLRGRAFSSWERRLEWLYSLLQRLAYSAQAYEALLLNAEGRASVLRNYGRGMDFAEYQMLRVDERFASLFGRDEAEWESNALRGLVLFAKERHALLDGKRLAVFIFFC